MTRKIETTKDDAKGASRARVHRRVRHRPFSLANYDDLGVFMAIMILSGAACGACGFGTRKTRKKWARCKRCNERVQRRSVPEAIAVLKTPNGLRLTGANRTRKSTALAVTVARLTSGAAAELGGEGFGVTRTNTGLFHRRAGVGDLPAAGSTRRQYAEPCR